jgi:hypothetical protein
VQDVTLASGLDTFMVAAAFAVAVAFGIFRLDSIVARPKGEAQSRERTSGTDEQGEPVLCDPDGRPWADSA